MDTTALPTEDATITKVEPVLTVEDDALVVDFLTKSYLDSDIFHILPSLTPYQLEAIKSLHCDVILRGMRDYYLIRKHSDDRMDNLESMVLEKLEGNLAIEMDSMKLLKMFQVLNSAKRRSEGEGQTGASVAHTQKVVQLQMPLRMLQSKSAPTFETNSNNEVIKIGKMDMATATNTQVLTQLTKRQTSREELLAPPTTEDI